jgi:hypothetical protein
MEKQIRKWETTLQSDEALLDRLQRLNPDGYPAAKKGDILALKVKSEKQPIVVCWNGEKVSVERRQPKNPFMAWTMDLKQFKHLFLSGKTPPVLVAMNNDQKNVKASADHHNGSLALSFMVMFQECMEGGKK